MTRLLKVAAALLCAVGLSAFGQSGVYYDGRASTVQTHMPTGANAPVLAIPGAKVLICTTNACTTQANIYQDQALTIAAPNPITAGGATPANLSGVWGFWAAPGTLWYQITVGSTVYGPYPITRGGAGGSSGLTSVTEVPTGAINGSNRAFTISNSPLLLLLDLNGLLMTQGTDYTLAGNAITFTGSLPFTSDKLIANYFFGSSSSLTPFQQTPAGTLNGTNTAFTLTHTPVILFLSRNGVQLAAGTDYTLTGSSLTMTVAPQSGDIFNAQYFY